MEQWNDTLKSIQNFVLKDRLDGLGWTLDASNEFLVSSLRCFLDVRNLFGDGVSTRCIVLFLSS